MTASDQAKTSTGWLVVLRWILLFVVQTLEMVRCLRRRWRLFRMLRLDDHMLDDIGITREELHWATRLPLRVNAAHALHSHARYRRECERGSKTFGDASLSHFAIQEIQPPCNQYSGAKPNLKPGHSLSDELHQDRGLDQDGVGDWGNDRGRHRPHATLNVSKMCSPKIV